MLGTESQADGQTAKDQATTSSQKVDTIRVGIGNSTSSWRS
jgi:hypothetical protein